MNRDEYIAARAKADRTFAQKRDTAKSAYYASNQGKVAFAQFNKAVHKADDERYDVYDDIEEQYSATNLQAPPMKYPVPSADWCHYPPQPPLSDESQQWLEEYLQWYEKEEQK
jgi:hypothetical protein